jgi:hypothetical protein
LTTMLRALGVGGRNEQRLNKATRRLEIAIP